MPAIALLVLFAFFVGQLAALAIGWISGKVYAFVWDRVHGPDRTRWARLSIALVSMGLQALWAAAILLSGSSDGLGLLLGAPFLLVGMYVGLAPKASPDLPAREPDGVVRDHDGWEVTLRWKPAWLSALAVTLAFASPLPMGFAAYAWSRGGYRLRVRLRGGELEVGEGEDRVIVGLRGASLADGIRPDGTPVLRVGGATIPLGGLPTDEVAWLRETLQTAIDAAVAVERVEAPEALRRLAARVAEGA